MKNQNDKLMNVINSEDFAKLEKKTKEEFLNEAVCLAIEKKNIEAVKTITLSIKKFDLSFKNIIMTDMKYGVPFYLAVEKNCKELHNWFRSLLGS